MNKAPISIAVVMHTFGYSLAPKDFPKAIPLTKKNKPDLRTKNGKQANLYYKKLEEWAYGRYLAGDDFEKAPPFYSTIGANPA
jgi:hypothetical protein